MTSMIITSIARNPHAARESPKSTAAEFWLVSVEDDCVEVAEVVVFDCVVCCELPDTTVTVLSQAWMLERPSVDVTLTMAFFSPDEV